MNDLIRVYVSVLLRENLAKGHFTIYLQKIGLRDSFFIIDTNFNVFTKE